MLPMETIRYSKFDTKVPSDSDLKFYIMFNTFEIFIINQELSTSHIFFSLFSFQVH